MDLISRNLVGEKKLVHPKCEIIMVNIATTFFIAPYKGNALTLSFTFRYCPFAVVERTIFYVGINAEKTLTLVQN